MGTMTKQYAKESDIIETFEYKTFLKEVGVFSLNVQSSMPVLKNDVFKS